MVPVALRVRVRNPLRRLGNDFDTGNALLASVVSLESGQDVCHILEIMIKYLADIREVLFDVRTRADAGISAFKVIPILPVTGVEATPTLE